MYRGKFLSSSPVSRNGENIEGAETTTRVREASSVPPIVNPRRNRVQTGSKRQAICKLGPRRSKPSALAQILRLRHVGSRIWQNPSNMSSRNTGNRPQVGDLVVLTATPPGLPDGLPE